MKLLLKTLVATALLASVVLNNATADVKYVNLSALANHDGQEKLGKSYNNLPREQVLSSVRNATPFIIHQNANKKIFVLASGSYIPNMPDTVNIPLNDYASKIHFFGHIHFETPNNRILGKYSINFEDASSIDVLLDNDSSSSQWNIDDHCCNWRAKDLTKASLAWEDASQSEKRTLIREFVWQNPAPNKKIASIDFVSFKTTANPVLAAITYYTPDGTQLSNCETPTVKSNLDIHIPTATYQSGLGNIKLWADLEYAGQNASGQLLWRLKDFSQIN
ncbi:MAG: hypothetical protein QX197_15010 [Methylococcaceae bacterium]